MGTFINDQTSTTNEITNTIKVLTDNPLYKQSIGLHPSHPFVKKIVDDPDPNVKKIVDDYARPVPPQWNPIGPIKYDAAEGLLPFILATPHQYTAATPSFEDQKKASLRIYDAMIQQAQYQINMLNAHVDSLNKLRDKLNETQENQ